MASLTPLIRKASEHVSSTVASLIDKARSMEEKPTSYERLVNGIVEDVYDEYRLMETHPDLIGPSEADSGIVIKAFKNMGAVLPSKNPQSTENERNLEAALVSLIEYAALVNKAKNNILLSMRMLDIVDNKGKRLQDEVRAL